MTAPVPASRSGVAVLIVQDGQASHRNSGLADRANSVPVTEHTMFELASLSKHFTAAAILRLGIDLDRPIGCYVPELKQPATALQLLWHTSGLPDYTDLMHWHDGLTSNEVIWWLSRQDLVSQPGAVYSYVNSNYVVLAAIVERVARAWFPDFMRDEFFGPLRMASTMVFQPFAPARGYDQAGRLLEHPNRICGDGSVWTCTADMAKWVASLDRSSRMFQSGQLGDGTPTGYGFGMNVEADSYWHGGRWAGYRCLLSMSRTRRFDAVVLANTQDEDVWGILGAASGPVPALAHRRAVEFSQGRKQ